MLKSISHIVFVIYFLSFFIGVSVNKHYSKVKLFSTAIFAEAETCCANMQDCKMNMTSKTCKHEQHNNDCSCKDETEIFKISDDFIGEKYSFTNIKIIDLFNVNFSNLNNINCISLIKDIKFYSSPPKLKPEVQSEYCVYII